MENWYVLFTKPNSETKVSDQLAERGMHPYLPLIPRPIEARPSRSRPLFPRYLFVRVDLSHTSPDTIRWIPGLIGFVTFGDDRAQVSDAIVAHLERRLLEMQSHPQIPFAPGQRVCFRADHPLAALDAVFEKPLSDQKRARILINVLGRLAHCEVAISDLRAAALPA